MKLQTFTLPTSVHYLILFCRRNNSLISENPSFSFQFSCIMSISMQYPCKLQLFSKIIFKQIYEKKVESLTRLESVLSKNVDMADSKTALKVAFFRRQLQIECWGVFIHGFFRTHLFCFTIKFLTRTNHSKTRQIFSINTSRI